MNSRILKSSILTVSLIFLGWLLPGSRTFMIYAPVNARNSQNETKSSVAEESEPAGSETGKKSARKSRKWHLLPFSSSSPAQSQTNSGHSEIFSGAAEKNSSPAHNKSAPDRAVQPAGTRPSALPAPTGILRPAPPSAQIVVVPFLVAAHKFTLCVLDAENNPVGSAGVFLDDELLAADENGLITLTVPDKESFELSLLAEDKRKISRHRFVCNADKVYSEDDRTSDMAASLLKTDSTTGSAPQLVYTPAVLSPGEWFVVVGRNLSEKIADDYLEIDGLRAKILSASPDGVLAAAPVKLRLGPLREISMTVAGQATNAAELDIAAPFFTHTKTEADDVSPEKGKIGMNGTNVPCLLRLVNNDIAGVSLWSAKQDPLGKNNIMLIPGGDQNYLNIDVRLVNPDSEPKVALSLVQELACDAESGAAPPQLLNSLCRAEIVRLERRRISAQFRLQELSPEETAESPAGGSAQESEKISAEKKTLVLRLRRLSAMLAARKAVLEALGSTEAQYRQAIDDAAGGALYALDQSIKPIQIISDNSVGVAGSAYTYGKSARRGRPLRLLEPTIHLLPPMDESQLALLASRGKPAVGEPAQTSLPDEPTLRPSLPEPEPEVKASNRAALPPEKKSTAPANEKAGQKEAASAHKSTDKKETKSAGKKKENHKGRKEEKKETKRRSKAAAKVKPESAAHSRHRHGKKSQVESHKTGRKRKSENKSESRKTGGKKHGRQHRTRHG